MMRSRTVVVAAVGMSKSLCGGVIRSCGGVVQCRLAWMVNGGRAMVTSSVGRSGTVVQQTQQQRDEMPGKWDVFTGIVLERRPLISQEMTKIEKEFAEMMSKVEVERSKKSDHEIKKEKDVILLEKIKTGEVEADQVAAQTAQDLEDLWSTEFKSFVPASRITEADKKNDQKSLERALDSHLLLVVEQKIGNDFKWVCPHGKWEQGETLRQTAERTMKQLCPEVKAKVLGNAPWGVYKYKYPQKTKESLISAGNSSQVLGAKVFFYKAQLTSGEVKKTQNAGELKDFAWLRRSELESKLHPEYYKQLAEVLINEDN